MLSRWGPLFDDSSGIWVRAAVADVPCDLESRRIQGCGLALRWASRQSLLRESHDTIWTAKERLRPDPMQVRDLGG